MGVNHFFGLTFTSFRRLITMGSPFIGLSLMTSLRQFGCSLNHLAFMFLSSSSESGFRTAAHREVALLNSESRSKSFAIVSEPTASELTLETIISSVSESDTKQCIYVVLVMPCSFLNPPSRVIIPLTLRSWPPAVRSLSPSSFLSYLMPCL